MGLLSSVIQLVGLGLITTGAFMLAIPLGFIVGGVALLLIGLAVGRD